MEWLGEIPAGWDIWKIAHSFDLIGSGTTPPSDFSKWYDGTIHWVTTSELRENVICDTENKVTIDALKEFSPLKIFPEDTLLIAMYGATIGRLGILKVNACTNQACCALAKAMTLDPKFTYYWFWAFREQIISLSSGGGQPNINQEKIKGLRVPAPIISEQRAIAAFLDRETARLDALVEKKRRLIALLEEKRAAVISRAVTRGLDESAPMKDSGVEWLGEIPAGWEVRRLKNIAPVSSEKLSEKPFGLAYLGLEHIESKTGCLLLDAPVEDVDSNMSVFEKGDVLFGKLRPYLAKVVHANSDGVCTTELLVLKPNSTSEGHFLFYQLLSDGFILLVNSMTYGTKMPRASGEQIGNIVVPLPNLLEQRAIAAFLDRETTKIDTLIAKIHEAIAKLQEYRTALISAAVTGKIDVREANP